MHLKGKHVYLRALEPEDLEVLYTIENDTSLWHLSNTQVPFSKYILKAYLKNAQQSIYEAKQLRLSIDNYTNKCIGLIDVFDFDPKNKRAGIGIVVMQNYRGKGYANEALKLLVDYCFTILHLHQVYANIEEHNLQSLTLFKKNGFKIIGLKNNWNFNGKNFTNEYMLQRINL